MKFYYLYCFYLINCSWFVRKPPRTLDQVPIPPLRGDEQHSMTVLPYLMLDNYGEDSSNSIEYYTERQLNGNICFFLC